MNTHKQICKASGGVSTYAECYISLATQRATERSVGGNAALKSKKSLSAKCQTK